jgi:hypothetical protein
VKPWLEKWEAERPRVVMAGTFDPARNRDRVLALFEDDEWKDVGDPSAEDYEIDKARAALASAAPTLVRALLAVEWHRTFCPACRGQRFDEHANPDGGHDYPCTTDEALTAAGLATQAQRDEARREIAEAGL